MRSILEILNESISINEAKFTKVADLETMIKTAVVSLGSEFNIDLNVSAGVELGEREQNLIIKHCIGNIVENVIAAGFAQIYGTANAKHILPKEKVEDGENGACDIVLKTVDGPVNIEIKSYTKLANVKPSDKQWDADYILCVKYKLSGTTVTILEVTCVEPNNPKDENGNRAHIKITRDMINKGIAV